VALDIDILVKAKDMASRVLRDVGDESEKAGSKTREAWAKVGDATTRAGRSMTMGVTLPLIGAATASTVWAQQVVGGLREVNTLFGLTGDEAEASFAQMSEGVSDLSAELGIAQDTLVGGLYSAISAGVPKDNAFEFMRVASKAAVAGVTDTEVAVDGLTTIINAWGLEAADAERVADSMFTTVKGGKTTFEELSGYLFQVAPAAAAAGVSVEEVNAALAALTAAGTPTAQASTQLRQAIIELSSPTGKVAEEFQKLSGTTFREFAASGGTVQEALSMLSAEAENTGLQVGDYFSSVEASMAATSLAGKGAEKFASELENQANKAGAVGVAFEEMDKSRSFERVKTAMQNAGITLGNALLPMAEKVADVMTKVAEVFSRLSPEALNVVIAVGAVAAAIGPLLLVAGGVISAVTTIAGFLAGPLAGAVLGIVGPIALVVAAVALLVIGFVTLWKKSESFRNFWIELWDNIKMAASTVYEGGIKPVIEKIGATLSEMKARMEPAMEGFKRAWEALKPVFTALAAVIGLVVTVVLGLVMGLVNGVVSALGGIAQAIAGAVQFVAGILGAIVSLLTGDLDGAWEHIKTAAQGVADFFVGIFSAIGGLVSGFVDGVITFFTNLWDELVGHSIVPDMVNAILAWFDTLVARGTQFFRDLVAKVVGLILGLADAAIAGAVMLVNGILDRADKILPGFKDTFLKVTGYLTSLVSTMLAIGGDIIGGLVNGLENGVKEVMRVATKIADGVKNTIKNVLDINSPSGFTEWVGRMTKQGLVDELNDSREVEQAAGGMMAQVKGAMQPVASIGAQAAPSSGAVTHMTWEGDIVIPVKDLLEIQSIVELFETLRQKSRMAYGTQG